MSSFGCTERSDEHGEEVVEFPPVLFVGCEFAVFAA